MSIEQELARGAGISIINLVDSLIEKAHDMRASDIHIGPGAADARVRFRVDGVLNEAYRLPRDVFDQAISRIKVIAGLRIDEHQAAQDGRFRLLFPQSDEFVDIRVSIAPAYHGEHVVMRLLSDHHEAFTLENLGFTETDRERIERAIRKPSGMILATGPTGSGKTTTLYTLIKLLNTHDISIVTIEDPIEYAIQGIEQIQVSSGSGLTFAAGLRTILRQDPNIIMVGEIRDAETASIAVNTALTGHLLLSTLHTNDASTTLARLMEMRIEPYLVASTVSVAIGQRLVRKLCESCKEAYAHDAAERALLEKMKDAGKMKTLYRAKGCKKCSMTGYQGRVSINEVLEVSDEIREAILRRASASEIKEIGRKQGMRTMLEDGLGKVSRGVTALSEVLRAAND